MKLLNKKRTTRGLTMMEMVLVLAIIALLMGVAIKGMGGFLDRGRKTRAQAVLPPASCGLRVEPGLYGNHRKRNMKTDSIDCQQADRQKDFLAKLGYRKNDPQLCRTGGRAFYC